MAGVDVGSGGLSRRQVIQRAAYLGAGVTMFALPGCGDGDSSNPSGAEKGSPAERGKSGGVLNVTIVGLGASDSLDPCQGRGTFGGVLGLNVYGLLATGDSKGVVTPYLAESATPGNGAKSWTFVLREGLTFSDGSPLTADDVVFTFQRILDPKLISPMGPQLAQFLAKSGVTAVDERTVQFKLKTPNADFLAFVAQGGFAIVKNGTTSWTPKTAIGAGPFMVKSFAAGESFELERNPHYFEDGLPYLDSIRVTNARDPSLALRSVLSGGAHLGGNIEVSALPQIEGNANTKLVPIKNAQWCYIVMDSTVEPWNNPDVVEAVKLAVNREQMAEQVFRGQGSLVTDIKVPQDSPYYPPSLGVREQDIEKAKQLLAGAGYPDGIEAELLTTSAYAGMIDYASAFAEMVAPAGIKVKIQQSDPATYFSGTASGVWLQKPFYVSYSVTRPPSQVIPRNYIDGPGNANNETKIDDPEINDLWAKASGTVDDDERTKLYHEIFTLIAGRASNSIASSVNGLYAAKSTVEGLVTDPVSTFRFREVSLA